MYVVNIIQAMGGRAKVASLVQVCPAQMTQMRTRGKIADHHIRLFIALRPELDWLGLLGEDFSRFGAVLNHRKVRSARRRHARRLRAQSLAMRTTPTLQQETFVAGSAHISA